MEHANTYCVMSSEEAAKRMKEGRLYLPADEEIMKK